MRIAERPYVICHMLPSIDGRIVIRDWKLKNATREYEAGGIVWLRYEVRR